MVSSDMPQKTSKKAKLILSLKQSPVTVGRVKKLTWGADDAWEDLLLGAHEVNAEVASDVDESEVDEALGLKMISIRLEASLIEDFKAIATLNGLGYQTLMRQALKRFTDGEKK